MKSITLVVVSVLAAVMIASAVALGNAEQQHAQNALHAEDSALLNEIEELITADEEAIVSDEETDQTVSDVIEAEEDEEEEEEEEEGEEATEQDEEAEDGVVHVALNEGKASVVGGSGTRTGVPVSKVWLDSVNGIPCEHWEWRAALDRVKASKTAAMKAKAKGAPKTQADINRWEHDRVSRITSALNKSGKDDSPHAVKPVIRFVLHTTGGPSSGATWWDNAEGVLTDRGFWPHFLAGRSRNSHDLTTPLRCVQFFPLDVGSFALAGDTGDQSIQIEILASEHDIFTAIDTELAQFIRVLFRDLRTIFPSIPNQVPYAFNHREAGSLPMVATKEWQYVHGLVGHMHAPQHDVKNGDHSDPGDIDVSSLIEPDTKVNDCMPTGKNDKHPPDADTLKHLASNCRPGAQAPRRSPRPVKMHTAAGDVMVPSATPAASTPAAAKPAPAKPAAKKY